MKTDIIIAAQDGWILCPTCCKKLQRITHRTTADNLPIWCSRCKTEYTIKINRRDRSA